VRAVRLVGGSRPAFAGLDFDKLPVNRCVGPKRQAAMRSRGTILRMGQRPSIRRPRP